MMWHAAATLGSSLALISAVSLFVETKVLRLTSDSGAIVGFEGGAGGCFQVMAGPALRWCC
jgi:hypothetical protein